MEKIQPHNSISYIPSIKSYDLRERFKYVALVTKCKDQPSFDIMSSKRHP